MGDTLCQFREDIQGTLSAGDFLYNFQVYNRSKGFIIAGWAVPVILVDGNGIVEFGVEKVELPIFTNALDLILQKD